MLIKKIMLWSVLIACSPIALDPRAEEIRTIHFDELKTVAKKVLEDALLDPAVMGDIDKLKRLLLSSHPPSRIDIEIAGTNGIQSAIVSRVPAYDRVLFTIENHLHPEENAKPSTIYQLLPKVLAALYPDRYNVSYVSFIQGFGRRDRKIPDLPQNILYINEYIMEYVKSIIYDLGDYGTEHIIYSAARAAYEKIGRNLNPAQPITQISCKMNDYILALNANLDKKILTFLQKDQYAIIGNLSDLVEYEKAQPEHTRDKIQAAALIRDKITSLIHKVLGKTSTPLAHSIDPSLPISSTGAPSQLPQPGMPLPSVASDSSALLTKSSK